MPARSDALADALRRASEPPCALVPCAPPTRKRASTACAQERRRKRRALSRLRGHASHTSVVAAADWASDAEAAAATPLPPSWLHAARDATCPAGTSPLHREIVAFAAAARPTAAEVSARDTTLAAISAAVAALWPEARVLLFGSSATGLALPSSDLDVVVVDVPGLEASAAGAFTPGQRSRAVALLGRLRRALCSAGALAAARVIAARVPIIKGVAAQSGVPCDISLGVANGAEAVPLVRAMVARFPQLRPLVLVLKSFLAQRGLNNPFSGGVGGYALLNLVTAFLQHAEVADLGDSLAAFFAFYGRAFDYRRCGVSVARGGVVPKPADVERAFVLAIEDPQAPGTDIGGAAFNIRKARQAFAAAAAALEGHRDAALQLDVVPSEDAQAAEERALWAAVQADGHTRAQAAARVDDTDGSPVLGRILCIRRALRRRPLPLRPPKARGGQAAPGAHEHGKQASMR